MNKRQIGNSDLHVAPLAFGGNVFGWTVDEAMSFKLLDGFVDAGLNLIDTADVYSVWQEGSLGGESETIIGKWLKASGKRDKVVIATKVGMKMSRNLGCQSLSKAYIFKSVEDSLRRLQIETIDLYQAHNDDQSTPLEETLEAFSELIKQGKVRAIGASNYTADRLTIAMRVSRDNNLARYECMQPEYNLNDRADYEAGLEALCIKENIAVIPYFSLARGFLTGKYRSEADLAQSPRGEGVKKYMNQRGFTIIDAAHGVAGLAGGNPAQIALAWLIARPGITAPIASATNMKQLDDLIAASRLELAAPFIELLNAASRYESATAKA
ncbi:MAG: aldo/keto reductase [Candidatus Obscuribacterales bacterium]|nr:aldo/keto reductase [Candidatus Obscuribacterales bacterium]